MSKKNKKDQAEQVARSEEQIVDETIENEGSEKGLNENNEQKEAQVDEISKLEDENAQLKDTLLRKAAELDNVKKRVQREKVANFEEARIASLKEFLPIYDDLLRIIEASSENKVDSGFLTGVELVVDKFSNVLKKYNVEPIDKVDIPFDVDLHDALLRQPSSKKNTPSNTVIQILERGYKMGNKTISHAKVIVSE